MCPPGETRSAARRAREQQKTNRATVAERHALSMALSKRALVLGGGVAGRISSPLTCIVRLTGDGAAGLTSAAWRCECKEEHPTFAIGAHRYDQETFQGRLLGILDVIDPRTLFVSSERCSCRACTHVPRRR